LTGAAESLVRCSRDDVGDRARPEAQIDSFVTQAVAEEVRQLVAESVAELGRIQPQQRAIHAFSESRRHA